MKLTIYRFLTNFELIFLQISSFFPALLSCCASTAYKIRELAAKAFVTLAFANSATAIGAMLSNIRSTLEQAKQMTTEGSKIVHHNRLHGYLLQVRIMMSRICL